MLQMFCNQRPLEEKLGTQRTLQGHLCTRALKEVGYLRNRALEGHLDTQALRHSNAICNWDAWGSLFSILDTLLQSLATQFRRLFDIFCIAKSEKPISLKCATSCYYKVRQVLQSASGITKCDSYYKVIHDNKTLCFKWSCKFCNNSVTIRYFVFFISSGRRCILQVFAMFFFV